MEALSGAASGIAVVSLSIQLIECVGSIKTFIHNVKDAQKELERLVDLLERLEALLEDVRALMERQASLEHFPTPSATIFKCLKSCKKTLEPLQTTVDKYAPSKSKASTSMDRLKTGLRIGFKAKDIQDFESRIEREINFLHASLGANCGAILIQLGPTLLRNQSKREPIHQSPTELISPKAESVVVCTTERDTMLSNARAMRSSLTIIPVHSPLERVGIYQRKVVRRVPCTSEKQAVGCKDGDETIVSEAHETTLLWSILGHGLTWIQRRSFGRVVPSLRTFPVVKEFSNEIRSVFENGEMQDFQDLLHRDVIHPFSRDYAGRSLLHIAAGFCRADMYLLLRNLGLKQNTSIFGETPLEMALNGASAVSPPDPITIYRYILEDHDLADDPITYDWDYIRFIWCHMDSALWLYHQSVKVLPHEESCVIRARIVYDKWRLFCWKFNAALYTLESPSIDLDVETLNVLKERKAPLLLHMFLPCLISHDSFVLGEILLGCISNLGINVEQFINDEVEIANASEVWLRRSRRYVFEPCEEGGWRLGFEFAFDREASGYLIASEYEAMFTDKWGEDWPISRPELGSIEEFEKWALLQKKRFQRRMNTKARKGGGQKKRKSKMPGAWVP